MCSASSDSTPLKAGKRRNASTIECVRPLRRVDAFEGWQPAGLNALRTEGYVQANGRLQRWNSRGLRPQGLVEAAARKLPRGALGMDALTTEGYAGKRPAGHFKHFRGLKAGKRQA